MDFRLSVIICVVALAVWIAATIGERKLRKKRELEAAKFKEEQYKRFTSIPGVYLNGGNGDQHGHNH